MGGSVTGDEARGALGSARRPPRAPGSLSRRWRTTLDGVSLAALVLLATLTLAACTACDGKPVPSDTSSARSTEQAAAPQETLPPAVENQTPVGQAVAAVAAPAIAEVLGEPVLTRAPDTEALVVTLAYQAPVAAAEGDGERLRDAFLSNGATLDAEQPDVDYHGDAEEFMLLYDTGNAAFQTIRVTVTPGSADIYVNADKAQ